jgi:hypothetical protein
LSHTVLIILSQIFLSNTFGGTKSSLEIRLTKPPRNTTPMSNPLGLSLRNPRGLTVFVGGGLTNLRFADQIKIILSLVSLGLPFVKTNIS